MTPEAHTTLDAELAELLQAVANRDLTESQRARLAERLAAEPITRMAYIRATAFDVMLGQEFPFVNLPVELTLREPKRVSNLRWWLAAAALIVLGLLLGQFVWRGTSEKPVAGSPDPEEALVSQFATITHTTDAIGFAPGQRMSPGVVDLAAGRLEITFDCGAVTAITGPARFTIESEYRGFLHQGQLTARVPPQADGFVIQTPTCHVRDLGTAFTLQAAADGATDLYVLEGSVEATSVALPNARPTVLRAAQARRFTSTVVEPLNFDGQKFTAVLPAAKEKLIEHFVHWSFDSIEGNTMPDDSHQYPMRLKRLNSDSAIQERSGEGRFGTALYFDGSGEFAQSNYPGIEGGSARTVAFWLSLPSTGEVGHPNCIVSWGVAEAAKKWEIQWNLIAHAGAVGALRLDFGTGHVIGSTDLRDGLWHHVAVVFHGGSKADVSTHVKLYVDGRLETLTGRRQQEISTDISSPKAKPVTLGRYIGIRSLRSENYFKGQLDELFIIEEALTPAQIVKLRDTNQLLAE